MSEVKVLYPAQKRAFRLVLGESLNQSLQAIDKRLFEGTKLGSYFLDFLNREKNQRIFIDHDGSRSNLTAKIAQRLGGRIKLPFIVITFSHTEEPSNLSLYDTYGEEVELEKKKVDQSGLEVIDDDGQVVYEKSFYRKYTVTRKTIYNIIIYAGDDVSIETLKMFIIDFFFKCPLHKVSISFEGFNFKSIHRVLNNDNLFFQDESNPDVRNLRVVSTLLEVEDKAISYEPIDDFNRCIGKVDLRTL